MRRLVFALPMLVALLLFACSGKDYTPKPRAYYRISLPEPAYQQWDTNYPYAFAYSTHAEIIPREDPNAEPYWINLHYPAWDATLHVSYKPVQGNLDQLVADARFFTTKQIPKAEDMIETAVHDTSRQVYGRIYEITGVHVACPYQFWLTDRKRHFFRAALYFHRVPNNDSIAPVLQFIENDMRHLVETFSWR
ncbi:MAG: hypothetical protein J5873_00400 [Bacteroidales bacterium]|nr:hypothetical protein [Bacteroidales bacterium]